MRMQLKQQTETLARLEVSLAIVSSAAQITETRTSELMTKLQAQESIHRSVLSQISNLKKTDENVKVFFNTPVPPAINSLLNNARTGKAGASNPPKSPDGNSP